MNFSLNGMWGKPVIQNPGPSKEELNKIDYREKKSFYMAKNTKNEVKRWSTLGENAYMYYR